MTTFSTEFHRDTACTPIGEDGRFDVMIADRWSVGTGANGGYIAGILTTAINAFVADRPLRSMTVHYLRPPSPGPATVVVEALRSGRSLTVIDARLERDGTVIAVARGAVALAREAASFMDRTPPRFPPAESLEHVPWGGDVPNADTFIRSRYDTRYVLGGTPAEPAGESESSGWLRTVDNAPVDQALAVALTDAWVPPMMLRTKMAFGCSTIDLTVQLFDDFADPYDGWCAIVNRSLVASDGYVETDSEVWTEDGRLLATGRQLSACFPRPPA